MIDENQENVFKVKSFTDKNGEQFIDCLAECVQNEDGIVDLHIYVIENGEQVLKFKHLNVVPIAFQESELNNKKITEMSVTFTVNELGEKNKCQLKLH